MSGCPIQIEPVCIAITNATYCCEFETFIRFGQSHSNDLRKRENSIVVWFFG